AARSRRRNGVYRNADTPSLCWILFVSARNVSTPRDPARHDIFSTRRAGSGEARPLYHGSVQLTRFTRRVPAVAGTAAATGDLAAGLPRSTIHHRPRRPPATIETIAIAEPTDSVDTPVTPCPIVQPSAVMPPKPIMKAP